MLYMLYLISVDMQTAMSFFSLFYFEHRALSNACGIITSPVYFWCVALQIIAIYYRRHDYKALEHYIPLRPFEFDQLKTITWIVVCLSFFRSCPRGKIDRLFYTCLYKMFGKIMHLIR